MSTEYSAEQMRKRKLTKRGLSLNLLLIGEDGSGKKTFINTLCNKKYFQTVSEIDIPYLDEEIPFTIVTDVINVNENGSVPIRLRVNRTKNFGYNLENLTNSSDLVNYIENEFKSILDEEVKINRNPRVEDNRIHIALYFLRATGRGINEFDLDNMKCICDKVNLIPIISKADGLTVDEVQLNKELINKSIKENGILVYNFLELGSESAASDFVRSGSTTTSEIEEEFSYLMSIQNAIPFTVISANDSTDGNLIRTTQWGNINIEDDQLCDFKMLKNVIFGLHIQEFKDTTTSRKYEGYRIEKLSSIE